MSSKRVISPTEQRAEYGQSLMAVVTPERFQRIVGSLVTQAEGGDLRAIALLLDRTIGVRQSIGDLGEPDRSPWSDALESFKLRRSTGA